MVSLGAWPNMALRLPEKQLSNDAIQRRVPRDNSQMIMQAMGNNPYARAIDQITPVIANALQMRAQLRQQAQDAAAVSKALETGVISPDIRDPNVMLNIYEAQTARSKIRPEQQERTVFVTDYKKNPKPYDEFQAAGGKLNFINDLSNENRDQNLAVRQRTLKWQMTNGFKSEPGVADLYKNFQDANRVGLLLEDMNPIADAGVRFFVAKQVQGGGVLSNQDISELGGSKAILDKLEQIIEEKKTGRLSDTNRSYYNRLTEKLREGTMRNMDAMARQYVMKNADNADIIFPGGGAEELYNKIMNDGMQALAGSNIGNVPGEYKKPKEKKDSNSSGTFKIKSVTQVGGR